MPDPNLPPETVYSPAGAVTEPPFGDPMLVEPGATSLPPASAGSTKLQALGEMALCSSLPTQILIGWTLRLAGWSPMDESGALKLGFITALTLLDTLVLIALMVGLMRARGARPAALWLGGRPVLREVLTGLTYVPVVFLIGSSLLLTMRTLAPQMHNVNVNPFEALAGNSLQDAALLGLVAIVAGGVREELQRAFLLDRFAYLGPPWAGVVLLSAAFGLGHLLQGRDAVVATGAMGAFWALIYLRRRSSVAPMVSHAVFNSIEVLAIFVMNQ